MALAFNYPQETSQWVKAFDWRVMPVTDSCSGGPYLLGHDLGVWKLTDMRILPIAFIACGLILTAAWVAFLGFEMFRAVELIF
jgi:hypothetical protein